MGIDLKKTKITNLLAPTLPNDAATKSYVDAHTQEIVQVLNKQFENGIDMGNKKVFNVANPTNPKDAANKEYVDSITSGTIDINRLPYQQYGFILEIGTNLGKNQKTSIHSIKLPLLKNVSYKKINLQISLLQEARQTHDDLFCSIKSFDFENIDKVGTIIMIIVDTHKTFSGWGIHLKAHLLISNYETEMTVIPNNVLSPKNT